MPDPESSWLTDLPRHCGEQLRSSACSTLENLDLGACTDSRSRELIAQYVCGSPYAAQQLVKYPGLLNDLVNIDRLSQTGFSQALVAEMLGACANLQGAELQRVLRESRHRALCHILWRQNVLNAPLDSVLQALSEVADTAINIATTASAESMFERHGQILDEQGEPVLLRVLAMGKLGGHELNFSSDIDLIFVYREEGLSNGPKPLSASEYFTRQARRFIALLDEVTAAGFVYRVDARLRPFGDSGALVVSLDALESYLAQHGRDWERYAYVKARMVNADRADEQQFETMRSAFVYRRYLDYGVFDSLRDMKRMIQTQVQRQDKLDNIKLGPGGIREIEFIVQSLQLVRGGREPELTGRGLRASLRALSEAGHISPAEAQDLDEAYVYLRRVENAIQGLRDQQLHDLPTDEQDRERLAVALGVPSYTDMRKRLDEIRQQVAAQFEATVFRTRETGEQPAGSVPTLWTDQQAELQQHLEELGAHQSGAFSAAVSDYHVSLQNKPLDEESRRRVDIVAPALVRELASKKDAAERWQRLCKVLDAIVRRSAYISLLIENPDALKRFTELAGGSSYLAKQLAAHPLLLDELLDNRFYQNDVNSAELDAELDARLSRVNASDPEAVLEGLARFKRVVEFRTAVADVTQTLPIMRVSDQLTLIAERIVRGALDCAMSEALSKYGTPRFERDGQRHQAGFCVVAYGKLAGLELGYGSDLDIVFLHNSDGEQQETDGERSISNDVFFARLARRLVHFLSVQTSVGKLYEVDIRLRPSGRSGLMVSSIASFRRYQAHDAWTWEHQALLRSRAIAGSEDVSATFEEIRRQTLTDSVDRAGLKEEVAKMRERMRKELSRSKPDEFDLKQDPGGLADIEFLVQYQVLQHAKSHPELLVYPDNMRQIDGLLQANLIAKQAGESLQIAYLELRQAIHKRALDSRPAIAPFSEFAAVANTVRSAWDEVFA